MARIRISPEILEQQLFGGTTHAVRIIDAGFDHTQGIVFLKIEGDDVPAAEEVTCICAESRNRRGDRLISMHFEVVK